MNQKQMMTVGRFKVAYWNPSSAGVMNSKFFPSYETAAAFASKVEKNGMIYTMMENQSTGSGTYSWKVLDNGVGRYLSPLSQAWKYRKQIMYGTAGILVWRMLFK